MNSYRLLEAAWTVTIILVVALVAWSLTGCAPVQCLKPVVTLQAPVLPRVSGSELACLTDVTYDRLVARDLALSEALAECRLVVETLTDSTD